MPEKQRDFLEAFASQHPETLSDINELAELYSRKLWHQIALKVEECVAKPEFNKGSLLVDLYTNFVSSFAHKLNLLKLSLIAIATAKQFADSSDAIRFLEDVISKVKEAKLPRSDEPVLLLNMQIAEYNLKAGSLAECKEAIQSGKQELDSLSDVDPTVSASVYYVSSLYYKQQRDFAEFYKSSLMYLAYVSSDSLDPDEKLTLAVDISLAALLGDNIYNFGELLLHPIIKVMEQPPYEWLYKLLVCFNSGDLHQYDTLCADYAADLNGQPALVSGINKLREKITILSLMELIFSLPAEKRQVSLETIAERTKLTVDGVEFLLMKTLSLHLIEGLIDEVDGTVQVTWVQPRVLTLPQVAAMNQKLDGWISKVQSTAQTLEEESVGVAA